MSEPANKQEALLGHLTNSLSVLPLDIGEVKLRQLLHYVELLDKWNKAYNLTAIRDPFEMVSRHIQDSMSIAGLVSGERVIDVGTGAGLPGIPLAIFYPQKHFALLDSNGKKTRFLEHVARELVLPNVEVVNKRAEQFFPAEPFDSVLTRAVASLDKMVRFSEHLCADNGKFIAMKGVLPTEEIAALPENFVVIESFHLSRDIQNSERHIILIQKRQG